MVVPRTRGLEEYGVDVGLLILVEDVYQVALLLGWRGGLRPVQALKGGEPDSPDLMFRGLGRDFQRQYE